MTSPPDADMARTLRALAMPPEAPAPKHLKRALWLALTLGVALAVAASLYPARDRPQPGPASVEGAAADLPPPNMPPAVEITGAGYVVAPHAVGVHARQAGRIVSVAVALGDPVAAGQELARMDGQEAEFAQAGAVIARARAALTLEARRIAATEAQREAMRLARLAAREAAPRHAHEAAETALRLARNAQDQAAQDLAMADLALDRARAGIDRLILRAPLAGRVTALSVQPGDTVPDEGDSAARGPGLLVISDTSRLVIDADIAESRMALLRPGLRGEAVLDAFPDHPFAIRLARISPVAAPDKGTVSLRFDLTGAPAAARPHMAARIRIAAPDPSPSD